LRNEDQSFEGQAVLTIPLTNGGRVGSLVAQAQDRNAADRIGIEAARRQMVEAVVDAWNALATAGRNVTVDSAQVASAKVFDDGTFQEYRAGLRSTFDVLFAHGTLLNAEIALVEDQHNVFVAQATLLRHVGLLEARALLFDTGLYDPDTDFAHAARRGSVPWDDAVQALDRVARPKADQRGIQQPPLGRAAPVLTPGLAPPDATMTKLSPNVPLPGTTGTPLPDRSSKSP
jgi:outer membrane protein